MRRLKVGDIFQFSHAGDAFLMQIISRNKTYGDIVQVVRMCEHNRIELFSLIFPVGAAVRDGYLTYQSTRPIPEKFNQDFGLKYPNFSISTGDVVSWTVVRGGERHIVTSLNDTQIDYPYAAAVNIAKLEELIDCNWDGRVPIR